MYKWSEFSLIKQLYGTSLHDIMYYHRCDFYVCMKHFMATILLLEN